jgi:hypothetical protein
MAIITEVVAAITTLAVATVGRLVAIRLMQAALP